MAAAGGVTLPARARSLLRRSYVASLRLLPVRLPRQIGLFEALAYPFVGSFEWMRRHLLIIEELERIRTAERRPYLTVLDFGGADGSLARALRLYRVAGRYRLILADTDRSAVDAAPIGELIVRRLVIDRPPLPLPNGSVDVAVSSDVFEHIPAPLRAAWAGELSRIARLGQIHTMPLDSADGRWASSAADREFASWYADRYGRDEPWTAEHLANGPPTVTELGSIFGAASIVGFGNVHVWQRFVRDEFTPAPPWRRLTFAISHLPELRRADAAPPLKSGLVVVRPGRQGQERDRLASVADVGRQPSDGGEHQIRGSEHQDADSVR